MRTWLPFTLEYFSQTTARHSEPDHPDWWEETAVFLPFSFLIFNCHKPVSYQVPYEGQNWLQFPGMLLISYSLLFG